ncbi:MAG: hypothetical protein U5L03_15975 [Burkholderiaceae bacterium]|nr:hypothetical protein [Burkholderiaceae bacterium]
MRLNPRFAGLVLAVPLAAAAAPAAAQTTSPESAFTIYGAYRDGGSFIDASTDQKLRLDGSAAWAISFDKGLDGSRQLQFYVSYQNTDLGLEQSAFVTPQPGAAPASAPLPMKVMYFHFGGTNFFDGPIGQGPYLVGGLGATLFLPGRSGYSDELRPSLNLGIGYQVTLGERVALRVETRGYVTLVNSSGGLFCSGGCLFTIKGDAVTQGEVQLGLSYRF